MLFRRGLGRVLADGQKEHGRLLADVPMARGRLRLDRHHPGLATS